jgi:phage shock protein C
MTPLRALRAGGIVSGAARCATPIHSTGAAVPDVSRPLRRSRTNRQLAGVVGGLAEYTGMDPTLLRVVYVVGSIVSAAFPGALVYGLLWLLIPEAESGTAV